MWANKIELHDFRAFKNNFEMKLAKNITCISGHNGIGKSTILAVLSNCGELKKNVETQLNGAAFRGDFSDIIIGDEKFDSIGDKAKIHFSDLPQKKSIFNGFVPELEFRATFQDKSDGSNQKRYRLLPKKIPDIRLSVSKLIWPTIYLGLSRLYPVGESEKTTSKKLPTDIMSELLSTHQQILGMKYDSNAEMKIIDIKENGGKNKTGVDTSLYPSTSNSAGQDNIGQIILSILSFKRLQISLGSDYFGGILLIDEIDATLHPAVQFRLFDYLLKQSKNLDIQIVFTTHSITLLEHISKQYKNKSYDIKTCYLQKRTSSIEVKENPSITLLKNDLSDTYSGYGRPKEKIKLLTEDDVARWFFKLLLKYSQKEKDFDFDILDIDIGWQHIIKLFKSDPSTFKAYIALLDPDIRKTENEKWLIENTYSTIFRDYDTSISSIFRLPATTENPEYIEKILWDYVSTLDDDAMFYKHDVIVENNWQKHLVISHGPDSQIYEKISKENVRIKHWFNDNKEYLEIAVYYWMKDNEILVNKFLNDLLQAYKYKSSNITK